MSPVVAPIPIDYRHRGGRDRPSGQDGYDPPAGILVVVADAHPPHLRADPFGDLDGGGPNTVHGTVVEDRLFL